MDPQQVGTGFIRMGRQPQPIPALCLYTLTHNLPAEALALSALGQCQTQQLLLVQTATNSTKKAEEKVEAFKEPLSAETSLPTATKCLCEKKSTEWLHCQEPVFSLPGYFQFRFVGTVLHCLLPSVWILDLYARPCSLTRHCCWRKDIQKIIVNLPVAIGCAITLPQLTW